MRNYVQNNSKSKTCLFRNKSKSNQKLKLSHRTTSNMSLMLTQETAKSQPKLQNCLITSNFLINKKYYKAAIIQYEKFNANSIQSYLKGQHHNDYLDLAEIVKFYTPKQYISKYQKVSAQQKLRDLIKNSQQQKRIKSKCLHFYGVYYYLLRYRENQNRTMQKSLKKIKNSKKISSQLQHPNFLTQLKKKTDLNIFHGSQSRTKPILSTDTLQLQKLAKYLNTIFKKNKTNNNVKINMKNSQFIQPQPLKISKDQEKLDFKLQKTKCSTSINQFKQIMEQQFSQIYFKSPYKERLDDSQIYGLSELKRKKNKNKTKNDTQNYANLDKNTTDTRGSKRFSTNLHIQLSKIISTPKKEGKSKSRSQSKNQSRQKSKSKSSKTISLKKQISEKSKSKQKKTHQNLNSKGMKNSQKQSKYNKLTDTERLLFHTQQNIDILSRKNTSPTVQNRQKLKKIRSQKEIKISTKKKVKA